MSKFAYSNHGLNFRAFNPETNPAKPGEVVFDGPASEAELKEAFPEYESKKRESEILNQLADADREIMHQAARILEDLIGVSGAEVSPAIAQIIERKQALREQRKQLTETI